MPIHAPNTLGHAGQVEQSGQRWFVLATAFMTDDAQTVG